ncbi:putative heat shock protein hslv [Neospora caninum Liverpool]|uniref:Putative heat shock protein hslv n=1 Tax=Neospora caninum (strain Liverpool) TaxID=572307 RepID=F0VJ12_NEOCL|nr:putative heat shock protein hslv [Neospora caninum Liverpool]CBZ53723.1 putative heat shock protein hslv [Neospora caninum Liverpool]|eukprot:XP_003883755.1 putative heat shock protein hslv [Neospora caninum Liverpool]
MPRHAAARHVSLQGLLSFCPLASGRPHARHALSRGGCSDRTLSIFPLKQFVFQSRRAERAGRAILGAPASFASASSGALLLSSALTSHSARFSPPQSLPSLGGVRPFYSYGGARAGGGAAQGPRFERPNFAASPFVPPRHATTILCVRKGDQVCVAGDGMVSQGQMIVKPNARKIRRLQDGVICGFAGATADCFTLLEKLEAKLEEYPGQLLRSCVELAKQWRTDRYLRHLEVGQQKRSKKHEDLFPELHKDTKDCLASKCVLSSNPRQSRAVLIVADKKMSLEVSGVGDVLESHDGILGVGSGGPYAVAAARALYDIDGLSAHEICKRSMAIAASMCCHTNDRVIFEVLENEAKPGETPQSSRTLTDSRRDSDGSTDQAPP